MSAQPEMQYEEIDRPGPYWVIRGGEMVGPYPALTDAVNAWTVPACGRPSVSPLDIEVGRATLQACGHFH